MEYQCLQQEKITGIKAEKTIKEKGLVKDISHNLYYQQTMKRLKK